ncbi:polysaccharide pyruvyl transferase family protein [Actinopolymorpha sp. B17G11]|uniref:polysaccharide pyruvyl transferase family protein n=1 Tax=Actinopolymorpha sp. B17G11 TaxID=3160861 RepID=UPI0032E4A3EB
MSTGTTHGPRVLMVGAYERDNFGDLLFLLVTEKFLPNAQVVSSAPFSADMTALLDRKVEAYSPLLLDEEFDAVWTVGGQVGGTDLRSAFRMSAGPELYREYRRSSPARRDEMVREAAGKVHIASPYIPSLASYPLNAGAISVLNSVGVSGIRGAERYRREELIALLRAATLVSVRDKESSVYLTELGIEHRQVPDAVHAISVLRPAERNPDSDVAIFQASTSILTKLGHANVAAALVASEHLKGLRIRLLMAGTANGHDSVADFEKVITHAKRIDPGVDMEIVADRRPFDLCDRMREARVVIGTSLHVRIIACAYGIPRVTLSRTKPTRYARAWDPDMPFDVSLGGLDAAVGMALEAADRPEVLARSRELSQLAHDNLTNFAEQVTTLAATQTAEDKARRRDARRHTQAALLASRTEELKRAREELMAIRSSRTYRLTQKAGKIVRAIRRSLGAKATARAA